MSQKELKNDQLSLTFFALSHPSRRKMLSMLRKGEYTVKDLSMPFEMSKPVITKHLKILERAGLISRTKNAQWRPTKLEVKPLREAVDWLKEFKEIWTDSLDKLDDFLKKTDSSELEYKKNE